MIRSRLHILFLLLLACTHVHAQRQVTFSFDSLFAKYPDQFDSIIAHKEDYRLQLLYTRIDRDANNVPQLTTYSYDADKYYYYCASMMKLPACALTLEKLNNLSSYHVNMLDSLGLDSITCTDLSPEGMMLGSPYSRLSQYIKEMLLVSNNNAFNPVYDFLGQYDFQERMHRLGYASTVISNRYAGCDTIQNRRCDPVALYDPHTHQLKYQQPCIINQSRQFYQGELSPLVGDGYLFGGGLINEPKSFRFANYIKLSELHRLLTKLILPETQSPAEKLNLTRSDYQYLYKCMGMFPRECAYPVFDSVKYPDNYMKYFMGLDSGTYTMPTNIRIFNKVGQAYGFMTDCSYVVDTLNKVEFFLSCVMYTNADGILNDGKYEYDQTAYPFFHNIFNAVYSEELVRHKEFLPKLQLPDFSDTLLVKPVPKWLKVDTTKSIEEMETVLCSLADSIKVGRLYSRDDSDIAEEAFYNNITFVLAQRKSVNYAFQNLQKKDVLLAKSPDGKVAIFYWSNHVYKRTNTIIQVLDSIDHPHVKSEYVREDHFVFDSIHLYNFPSKCGEVYITILKNGLSEMLWTEYIKGDSLDRFGIILEKEDKKNLSSLLWLPPFGAKYHIVFDRKKLTITHYYNDMRVTKTINTPLEGIHNTEGEQAYVFSYETKSKIRKKVFKFDGTIFK